MGIADIFEALTAKDRPYKPGKTLSESLAILAKFKESGHIDPDLFDIFVKERVYLRYAREFLDPEQIDDVDAARVPGLPG
jgi:HD-GYP domain-containing protein (c-di-GMP phosphodiesterase class II)